MTDRAPTLTYAQLKALNPCEERRAAVIKLMGGARKWTSGITAAQARDAGCTFDDLVWVASALARTDKDIERRLRLWMADCAARVLHIYEKTESSEAPRKAIIAARAYARGEIGDAASDARDAASDARDAASDAAWAAARAARAVAWAAWAASDAAWAAWAVARAARAVARAARDAAWAAARAARDAAWAASDAAWAASDAAWAAEGKWQFDRLVEWLSANEPTDWPLPARAAQRSAA